MDVLEAKLGSLIRSAADFGKTVDYTVTVDGTTYNDWQVYYEDEEKGYVYLATKNSITHNVETETVASLTAEDKELYDKFRVGNWPKFTLVDAADGIEAPNSQGVAGLIKNFANFANKATYGEYVIGSIGSPTLELLVAGWNAKGYLPKMSISILEQYGYRISHTDNIERADGLYIPTNYNYLLAAPNYSTPGVVPNCIFYVEHDNMGWTYTEYNSWGAGTEIRPVVCVSSDIPAKLGTTTDISLIK